MIAYLFHPEANAEFEDAALFYESRMTGLGKSLPTKFNGRSHLFGDFPIQAHLWLRHANAFLLLAFHTPLSIGKTWT